MMKKDFNFEEMGTRTPYRMPEGCFERVQQRVMERTLKEKKRKRTRMWTLAGTAIAAAAMLTGVLFFVSAPEEKEQLPDAGSLMVSTQTTTTGDDMEQYIMALSDEELNEWIEFSENDIFIELN